MIKISDSGAFQIYSDFGASVNEGTAGGGAGGQGRALTFSLTQTTPTYSSLYWQVEAGTGSPSDFWDPNSIFAGGSPATSFPSGFGLQPGSFPFRIYLNADSLVEGDETFLISFYISPGFGNPVASASFTVLDDEAQQFSISPLDAVLAEGNGVTTAFTFSVTRAGNTRDTSSVDWFVSGSSAQPADMADFEGRTFPTGTVSFATGQTTATITVEVNGDSLVELAEGFTVTLRNPSSGTEIATASASGTINNDDASFAISVTDASKPEGTGGSTNFLFTITRTGDLTQTQSVDWAVTGSGAAAANAADFVGGILPSGTVSFAAGQSSKIITIKAAGDAVPEANEGFVVTLSSPSAGGTLAIATAEGLIQNDDIVTVSIAASNAVRAEGAAGATTPFNFIITRGGVTSGALALDYTVTGGALRPAVAADFIGGALPSGSINFAPGETSTTLIVNVAGDDTVGGNKDFIVTLIASPGVTLSVASAGGTILEDDPITDIVVLNGKSGQPVVVSPVFYTGPVAGIERELILLTPENLTIAVAGSNWFIHSGSGDDAIQAAGGTNVLDGGTGSNFLTGASGFDTFFIDARAATSDIWSTVNNFGAGDAITLWGVSDTAFSLNWFDGEGAPGFKGLTLHATAPGKPTASLTLPGFTVAQKDAGAFSVLFGHDAGSGSDYIYVLTS